MALTDSILPGVCTSGLNCNCYWGTDIAGTAGWHCNKIINAIELTWTLPYSIPDDTTTAHIECYDDLAGANYVTFYQSSLVT